VSLQLPRLPTGYTPDELQFWWQQVVEAIEANEARQDEAIEAIQAAQAAAENANAAAEAANEAAAEITSGSALSTSFIENFTPPVVSADNTGLVTIANHDRHYGDGTIVAVTGDALATGEAAGTIVYIYYSDPTRAGGTVTYQYSTAAEDAAQIGDVHNVGAVEIPAAGTQSGGYARPPGYGGIEP
jgi:hypothetical protein